MPIQVLRVMIHTSLGIHVTRLSAHEMDFTGAAALLTVYGTDKANRQGKQTSCQDEHASYPGHDTYDIWRDVSIFKTRALSSETGP